MEKLQNTAEINVAELKDFHARARDDGQCHMTFASDEEPFVKRCENRIFHGGNNPHPLKVEASENGADGVCDACNFYYVIPAREGKLVSKHLPILEPVDPVLEARAVRMFRQ